MAAPTLIPLFSPAGAADWATHFLAYATELDATGFPLRGSFGFGFHCYTDLSVAPTPVARRGLAHGAIAATYTRLGQELSVGELDAKVRQICTAVDELHPGRIVAFKKGISVVAVARITSDYRYEPAHEGTTTAIHRWDYEIVQKLAVPVPLPGRNATYYRDGYLYTAPVAPAPPVVLNVPEDVPEPVAPAPAPPTDAERIAALERQVAELQAQREEDRAALSRLTDVVTALLTARATETDLLLAALSRT
jgi:hypothetical protein